MGSAGRSKGRGYEHPLPYFLCVVLIQKLVLLTSIRVHEDVLDLTLVKPWGQQGLQSAAKLATVEGVRVEDVVDTRIVKLGLLGHHCGHCLHSSVDLVHAVHPACHVLLVAFLRILVELVGLVS